MFPVIGRDQCDCRGIVGLSWLLVVEWYHVGYCQRMGEREWHTKVMTIWIHFVVKNQYMNVPSSGNMFGYVFFFVFFSNIFPRKNDGRGVGVGVGGGGEGPG